MPVYANGVEEVYFFFSIQDFLLFRGAMQSDLNSGAVGTVILKKIATHPAASAVVLCIVSADEEVFDPEKALKFRFFLAHSTASQTLDIDFDYTVINTGDNVNTKAAGTTQTNTPTTPATAYGDLTSDFEIPAAEITGHSYISFKLTRETGGADTGDLHILSVGVYQ